MRSPDRYTALARVLVGAALILSVGGCFTDFTDAVYVQNNTNVPLHFTIILVDGRPFDLTYTVDPGTKFELLNRGQLSGGGKMAVNGCTVGDLIAYGPDGQEVARHPPGLCGRRHDVWTIWSSESPSASG